ncbi:MAG: DUF3467 domain-containing protein [Nitrospira sp.]|nr:DUF3467 domain-containing protein [Nitrospira sp.]
MATKRTRQDNPREVKITELPQRQAEGYFSTYSNHVEIGSSPFDIRLLFFEVVEGDAGNHIREKKVRVVMSPQHAVAFTQVLNHSIQAWVKEHARNTGGKIDIEETRGNK